MLQSGVSARKLYFKMRVVRSLLGHPCSLLCGRGFNQSFTLRVRTEELPDLFENVVAYLYGQFPFAKREMLERYIDTYGGCVVHVHACDPQEALFTVSLR